MKAAILVVGLVALSTVLAHADPLSNQAPVKPDRVVVPPSADPSVIRQGGDTVETATVIVALPYADAGTTARTSRSYATRPTRSPSPVATVTRHISASIACSTRGTSATRAAMVLPLSNSAMTV